MTSLINNWLADWSHNCHKTARIFPKSDGHRVNEEDIAPGEVLRTEMVTISSNARDNENKRIPTRSMRSSRCVPVACWPYFVVSGRGLGGGGGWWRCLPGACLPRGGGCVCLVGCLPLRCLLPRGMSAGGCLPRVCVYPSMQWGGTPPPREQSDWQV